MTMDNTETLSTVGLTSSEEADLLRRSVKKHKRNECEASEQEEDMPDTQAKHDMHPSTRPTLPLQQR